MKYFDKKCSDDSNKKPNISWSSGETGNCLRRHKGIMIGILCKEKRIESVQWRNIIGHFEERKIQIKSQVDILREPIHQIEEEIRNLKQRSREISLKEKMNKGEVEFQKSVKFYYGINKYDAVFSKKFKWTFNKGGKTVMMYTVNENGDVNLVLKTFKVKNLEYFLDTNR